MVTSRSFTVWAPGKKSVELVLDSGAYPMSPQLRGWWATEVEVPAEGVRYRFRVDGEGPYPDPRSPWQPEGVHGPSVTVDHSTFHWDDHSFVAKPLAEAVIYELHVGTFSPEGTYEGAAERLPHLARLGITHVELMPLHAFPGVHGWGYDGVSLYAPHAAYGTPDQLKAFVQRAHELGLAVLLDVVYNHFGPDGMYAGKFGPYLTNHYRTPWGDAVNFDDRGSYGVREFVVDNAMMWLRDYHFDGLRLDAVHAIHDESARHILEELTEQAGTLGSERLQKYVIIAESDLNSPRLVQPRGLGGLGLDAHWEDDFHHAIHAYFTGEHDGIHGDFGTLGHLAKALEQAYVYDGQFSEYRQADFGRPPRHVPPCQLVVFSQNHDQTGNRAQGERLEQIIGTDAARAISALVLFSPFVPMLFQGEEWGATTPFMYFSDHEPELGKLVAEGRRQDFEKFGWAGDEIPDPQERETFEGSKLNWQEVEEPEHQELLAWHRALIELRTELPHDGQKPVVTYDERTRWITVGRGDFLLVLNLAEQPQHVPLPEGEWHVRLASVQDPSLDRLPGRATVVLCRNRAAAP